MAQEQPIEMLHGRRQDLLSKADRFLARYYRPRKLDLSLDRAIVSFSFDDIPDNAVTNGARLLEEAGVRGSFYVAGALCGRRFRHDLFAQTDAVIQLAQAGHEVGCHTYSHADCQRLSADAFSREVQENEAFLSRFRPKGRFGSHAYPYGSVGLVQKRQAIHHFAACRSVWPGLNAGQVDLMQLRAVPLYDCLHDLASVQGMIEEAVASCGWLIFYTHDVQDKPSDQGTSCHLFEKSVDLALQLGADILPVQNAVERAYHAAGRDLNLE